MTLIDRRRFLSLTSGSLVFLANIPQSRLPAQSLRPSEQLINPTCWLDVCAPLVIQDRELGIDSDLVLTSDNFIGAKGYADDLDGTEYEIFLFQPDGKPIGPYGIAKRLTVSAMHTTVIPVSELVGNRSFWGGMKIRLRPKTRTPTHISDLFSSAFVRWRTTRSFANVHANPDPLEWQRADAFFYSMPFPPLQDYDCFYSVFNPYSQKSSGEVVLYDHFGTRLAEVPYDLQPCSSVLIDLSNAEVVSGMHTMFDKDRSHHPKKSYGSNGGTLAVTNHSGSVKNFGYLLMKQHNSERFSVEHPIHQPPFNPLPSTPAFDAAGRFAAKNILYTPLVFRSKRIGGVTLASRFHLSSGAPMEEHLWLRPFIVNSEGEVVWQVVQNASLHPTISHNQVERESIKLGAQQSCVFDCDKVELPKNFSGGLGLAITPNSNHTLMKVEILVKEWALQHSPIFVLD